MSATEWGKLIGIDRSTASRLLRGERRFNTNHVQKNGRGAWLRTLAFDMVPSMKTPKTYA
jgi:hypothetical protein